MRREWMAVAVAVAVAVTLALVAGCVPSLDAKDATAVAESLPKVPAVVVLDASGSMKADDAPGVRFAAAQNAVKSLVRVLSDEHEIGLIAYGTSTSSKDEEEAAGCKDIKTIRPFAAVDKAALNAKIDSLKPSGYTPIGDSLTAAAKELPSQGEAAIVLVSDGIDTCFKAGRGPDPCKVAKQLRKDRPALRIHTVGFKVADDPAARDQLSCIADAANGLDLDAGNSALLSTRLLAVFDPARAASSLQPSGYQGLEPGMSVAEAKEAAPKLDEVKPKGRVEIVYVDCTVVFDDGVLTEIIPKGKKVKTLDGVAIGSDVAEAERLYADDGVPTLREKNTVTYRANADAGTGYRISFSPESGASTIAGTITRIVLCRCAPSNQGDNLNAKIVGFDDVPVAVTAQLAGGGAEFLRVEHPERGRIWIWISQAEREAVMTAFDDTGTRLWTGGWISIDPGAIQFAEPPVDGSGNIFVTFNPGRYYGTIVLRLTGDSLEELAQSRRDDTGYRSDLYSTELIGPGGDGLYTIRRSVNDCDPDCAGGTVTETDLRWDGSRYTGP